MKLKNFLLIGLLPIASMAYGWYLGQLHQSMLDLAGILMFITGAAGLVLALGLRFLLKEKPWRDHWWANVLTGLAGVILVFVILWVYAQLRG